MLLVASSLVISSKHADSHCTGGYLPVVSIGG